MRRQLRIKTFLLTVLLVKLLVLPLVFFPVAYSSANIEKETSALEKKVETNENSSDQTELKRKEILQEATHALRETQNALKALDDKKSKEALAALERATGKLGVILARDPGLALAATHVDAVTVDLLADIKSVKILKKQIQDALKDGKLQQARQLIKNLASETVISVTNIPLATYPDAIKKAVKFIDDGREEDAKQLLQNALNTLVLVKKVIPLPIVKGKVFLKEAEKLSEKSDRTPEENKQLTDLLKDARTELAFAQELGYGIKKDFKNIYKKLDQIAEKIEDGKSGTGLFAKVKGYLNAYLDDSKLESQSDQKQEIKIEKQ